MKRKIIVFILSLIVAVTTVFAIQSVAFAANEATISVADVSAESGELVNVDIVISNNPGIIALRIFAEYDTSKLQLQSVTDGNIFAKGLSTFNDDLTADKYTMLWIDGASNTNYTSNGTLATLTFKVIEDTPNECIPVKITYDVDSTINSNLDNVSFSTESGSVTVEAKTYKVIWNVDGEITEQNVTPGSSITKPLNPNKDGYVFAGWTPDVPDKMPAYDLTFTAVFEKIETPIENEIKVSIRNPSTTTINYGDAIILHADIDGTLPAGARVEWTADNGNFDISVSADGTTCKISPKSSGKTVFTATVYDKDGNVISTDTQEMTAKAGLWQKIVAFFKKIFGLTKTIPEAFKGIF